MDVESLNYHHLRYFWAAAREGGVGRAAEKLRVSQPSLSAQIHALEEALDRKLFERAGRRLALTETGRLVFGYAEQIFGLGREMLDAAHDRPVGRPLQMTLGVANVVPKRITHRLLAPLLDLAEPIRLSCTEGPPELLLADLAVHRLDAVLSDAPAPVGARVLAFSHLLGDSGISFLGSPDLARRHRRSFPRSLDGVPMLLPTPNTSLRRTLEPWFERHSVRPRIVAELEDTALLEAFGVAGLGIFPVPTAVEADVRRQHGLRLVGRRTDLRERYYALTVQRRLRHAGVAALSERARETLDRRR